MEIRELFELTDWLAEHGRAAEVSYTQLTRILKHNSTQAQKQQIKEPLDELIDALRKMRFEQLSNEQIGMLSHLGIQQFFGRDGVKFVEETVKASEYDPVEVASEIEQASQAISTALGQMDQVQSAFQQIMIGTDESEELVDGVVIRIQFKDGASIEDVANWKKWSNEWYDIVRGVALCVNEAPEDIKVIGASKGSLIMILAGTIPFTKALTVITKHLSFIVKEVLEIKNSMEDLRHKKFMNKTIESELQKKIKDTEDSGIKTILIETKKELGGKISGEKENALKKAIEKYLNFNEKGGEVDFVEPAEEFESEDGEKTTETKEISDIRERILEIRSLREDVKLLQNHMDENEDANKGG